MTQTAYPKVGGATTDKQFRDMMNAIIETGATTPGGYAPTGDSSGMNVKIAAGTAFVSGIVAQSDAVTSLTIANAPGAGQSRIDTAVLQLDYTQLPIINLKIVQGTPAATGSQSPPSLAPAGNVVWNLPIADIAVGAGVVTIRATDVTDRRTFTGTNVGFWSAATRPAAPALRTFGYNTTTGIWEGWTGVAWVPVSTPAGSVGAVVLAANTVADAQNAIGIFVGPTAPANVAGRVWIKTAS